MGSVLNWQLALLSVIVVPFIVVISILFFRRVTKAYEAYQEQDAVLSTTLQENLTGVRVVRAFARQDYEEGQDARLGDQYHGRPRTARQLVYQGRDADVRTVEVTEEAEEAWQEVRKFLDSTR